MDELALIRGKVLTLSPGRPQYEGVLVRGGRIVLLGSSEAVRAAGPRARVVNLEGKAVLPGFVDAHFHLVYYGLSSQWLDLSKATSVEEILGQVRRRAEGLPIDAWIYGRGWEQDSLAEGRPPTRGEMDAAAPSARVMLSRRDGHACVVNSPALQVARIGADTPSPEGGEIQRDEGGKPTGFLVEMALYLVWDRYMAELGREETRAAILRASQEAARWGVTSAHAVLLEQVEVELEAFTELRDEGSLPLRAHLLVPWQSQAASLTRFARDRGDDMVRLAGVKVFADGTLSARTAALRMPYADSPGHTGMLNYRGERLQEIIGSAQKQGLSVVIHAVGDRAVEACLEALEAVSGPEGVVRHRHRLEHASVLGGDLVQRMASLGVIVSVQPGGTRPQYSLLVGSERARWVQPLSTMLRQGVRLAGGSDCPFVQETPNPLKGIAGAVLRPDGQGQEALTVEEALALYTRGGAYASFQEDRLGTLEEGRLADLVVLSRSPLEVRPQELDALDVCMTVVNGCVVHEKL